MCSFPGHPASVFVQEGRILVYALYYYNGTGCTLIAVDVETARELWRNQLQGAGTLAGASGLYNRVEMSIQPGEKIVVFGKDWRDYLEIVDLKSGRTLHHEIVPAAPAKDATITDAPPDQ